MTKKHTYILIDRSGSMLGDWTKTMEAVNGFAEGVKGKLHVGLFDTPSGDRIAYIRAHDGKAKDFRAMQVMGEHQPRGQTPLYDAVGRLNEIIMADKADKAQVVIVTDGWENSSREVTDPKAIVKGWEDKGYDVVYLGASFSDAPKMAAAMGIKATKTVNMADAESYGQTMTAMATRNTSYMAGETSAKDDLGDEVRKAADGGN